MSNPWFRLYSEFATDPKVQMMSEAHQRRLVMFMCMRCCNGDVTLHDEEVAFQLRISNEEWLNTKAVFVAKNFIGDDNSVTNWDKRQYVSDSSAERVARHRDKKKKLCNVTVTPPDTDTDTDTDIKTLDSCDKPQPPTIIDKPKVKAQRKTSGPPTRDHQLPADFAPIARHGALAAELGLNLTEEFMLFSSHHRSKGSLMRSWEAALDTWLRKSFKFKTERNSRPNGGSTNAAHRSNRPESPTERAWRIHEERTSKRAN